VTTITGEAFADLVRTEKDRVFRVALSVLGPGRAADAEDVAQEVFVRAHRALPSFRGESRVGTWLYRLAFNRAVDHRRRLRRRAEAPLEETGAETALPAAGAGEDPYRASRRAEVARAVRCALGRLSDRERAIVHLHYWLGHTVTEIGELLGLPAGTVKSHLHRGRERLRKELERHGT
jgi:RNA polymerase sigma-70 factor (ECF subfamily)